jgi:hypothetical protein
MDVNVRVTVDNAVLERLDKLIEVLGKCSVKPEFVTLETMVDDTIPEEATVPSDVAEENATTGNIQETTVTVKENTEPKATKDDVIIALQALAKKKSDKSASKSLLERFGATKVSGLKAEDYDAIIKAAEEMM